MRKLYLCIWLLLPVAAGAYHYGPGQDLLRADRAQDLAEEGRAAALEAAQLQASDEGAARARWDVAESAFSRALEELPASRVEEARALRLERAKAQMFLSKLPEARAELESLVDELAGDPKADPRVLDDARAALGNAQYYTTWLMRLEGLPREEWEPEIEASRQNFKLVAERAAAAGDEATAERTKRDLESSIRLARMDLDELQGLPLPSQ